MDLVHTILTYIHQLVDVEKEGGGKNGSCLWASEWLGVNASHPAAQAYYDSRVELLVAQGVDFIKADCMMCGEEISGRIDPCTISYSLHPCARCCRPLLLQRDADVHKRGQEAVKRSRAQLQPRRGEHSEEWALGR